MRSIVISSPSTITLTLIGTGLPRQEQAAEIPYSQLKALIADGAVDSATFRGAEIRAVLRGRTVPGPGGSRLFREVREQSGDVLPGLMDALLPATAHADLATVIREDLQENPPASERAGRMRALGLILGSPHFQRH